MRKLREWFGTTGSDETEVKGNYREAGTSLVKKVNVLR
jgi:hypothetical protein